MNTQHRVSEDFHKKYAELYDKLVVITLKDGNTIKGIFADEFYEDEKRNAPVRKKGAVFL